MLALAIECSTARASIAIKENDQLLHQEASLNPKTHSEFINAAIDRALQATGLELSQMDIFACTTGPGSFTGIRVASSVIKTFALLFKKPVFVTDSLSLLAEAAYQKNPQLDQVLCLINAHKNMAYCSLFSQRSILLGPASLKTEEIFKIPALKQALGLGDAFAFYGKTLDSSNCLRDSSFDDFPDAHVLADLALSALKTGTTIEWNLYKPLYIRDSEAEEALRLKSK